MRFKKGRLFEKRFLIQTGTNAFSNTKKRMKSMERNWGENRIYYELKRIEDTLNILSN